MISPWDAGATGAGADAMTWLGTTLGQLGFGITWVGASEDVPAELVQALARVAPEDSLLLLVTGRLARRGVLRLADGQWLPLRAVGEAVAARPAGEVTILAELVHEDDASDALVAADHVASAVSALGARERGHAMVAAVRPLGAGGTGLPFTRLFLETAMAAPRAEALLASVYQRVASKPESVTAAQSFTLVRGRTELELAPPPPSPGDLDAQLTAATLAKDWQAVLRLRGARLATLTSPRQRVKELVAIARVFQQELGDLDGAIGALEEAREAEPRRTSVLSALSRGYELAGRWASAIEVLGALAAATPMPVDRASLRYTQARMALEHLDDEPRALGWLEQALEDDPSHEGARAELGRLRASMLPPPPAAVGIEAEPPPPPAADEGDEMDPAVHVRTFLRERREGRVDAALLRAMALEELGASFPDLQAFIDQNRALTPLRAHGTLDAAAWEALRPYGMDEVLTELFGSVARAAVEARVEQLSARGRLVALEPAARLDESSTASVVRSFQWAARVLGVPTPDLYVVPDVPGEISAVRGPVPTTAVGPSIVSGRSAKDLAFLAGRHLTYYRGAHQVLVYFPTREELTRLLLAAVQVTKPDVAPEGEGARAVTALASRLERLMNDDERATLRHAVWELEARGGKFSLGAFTRNVELMAARVGLLLAGDLATATAIVSTETREIAGLPLEAKRRDLVGFCASDEHLALRERFAGVSASLRPPATASAGT